MIARREDVRQLLMRLDQEGVERRKKISAQNLSKTGTKLCLAYDKLFIFIINGCIDGYSKDNIISLEVSVSNRCSDLIACYYLKAAKNVNAVPKIIREDYRTEHSVIELIHLF